MVDGGVGVRMYVSRLAIYSFRKDRQMCGDIVFGECVCEGGKGGEGGGIRSVISASFDML